MFDDFSKRSKAVRAALDLAKNKGWGEVSLSDIAAAANLGLADLRREFTCKSDILRAFQAEVDAEVLAKARVAGEAQSPRDRLFDAIMTRFEAMQPYKAGAEARRGVSALPPRRGRAALLRLARLAILDARQRRRQARRPRRRAQSRRACRDLRQSVPGLARRRYAVARQDHGRARQAARQGRAHAVRHGSGLRRCLPRAVRFLPRGWKRGGQPEASPEPAASGPH